MAVPVSRRRRVGRRKLTGRMAEVKAKFTGEGPPAHGLRRKGRVPGSGATARSPRARGGSAVVPAVQPKKLTGLKARLGSSIPKSLTAMRAAAKNRASSATSGGSATPGTGPTPATTPRPKIGGTRGKSALAASRTGRPPAHGARRQGKTPGTSTPGRFDGRETPGPQVGSVSSSPKMAAAKKRIPKIKAMGRKARGY